MEKRKTIGVLIGGVSDDFTKSICEGLRKAAEDNNVNIVMMPGKYIDRDYSQLEDIAYEYQYEMVFSYAAEETLDGVIIAANCIGSYTTKERLMEFLHRYDDIPSVLVSTQIDGYASVNFDNYKGIHDGLEYLVRVLNCRQIGMIGGPHEISDAIERKKTYEDTLREFGIEPDPGLYVEGNFTGNTRDVFAKLLDDNPGMEAVFCVNDECAAGFYEELKSRNRMPGKDISVFGYDDMTWCSQIFPTLSSVHADASVLGVEAINLLLRIMKGGPKQQIKLPTQFVRRNSFCHPATMLEDDKATVVGQYLSMNHRLDEQRVKQNRVNYEMKHFIMKILRFEKGTDKSYGEIIGTIGWLGISNAFIYTFEEPIIHLYREEFQLPEYLYLKAMMCKGKSRTMTAMKQKTDWNQIFDLRRFGVKDRTMLVVLPLFSNEMIYGILVCDLTNGVLENGEFLGNQMSAAVKMLTLLKTNEKIMQQLEESLAVMQANNVELDTLTKHDPLTGILNRRGFMIEAEKMLTQSRQSQKPLTVLYVDMNNLKIINDRYGHDEGDFSLKTIAKILTDEVGKAGIVARIGGDEYACALYETCGNENLKDRIYRSFSAFNKSSDKPYNVTVSIGSCCLKEEDNYSLKDAMTLADEQLYEAKKMRKKTVAKRRHN